MLCSQGRVKDSPFFITTVDTANAFWESFIEKRAEIRERMGYATEARTRALRGEVLREIPVADDLILYQVKNEAGHRFGILQGVVMSKMPRLRMHLLDADNHIKRSYLNFTDTKNDRVVSGLELPWSRIKGVSRRHSWPVTTKRRASRGTAGSTTCSPAGRDARAFAAGALRENWLANP